MIRLCSRFDSVLFTPKMSAIPSYGNYSRSLKWKSATSVSSRSAGAAPESSATTRQGIKNTISPAGNVGERARRRLGALQNLPIVVDRLRRSRRRHRPDQAKPTSSSSSVAPITREMCIRDSYYPVLARAVSSLANNNAPARQELYGRARTFIVEQLLRQDPQKSAREIMREHAALETAIRKIEAESLSARTHAPNGPTPPRLTAAVTDDSDDIGIRRESLTQDEAKACLLYTSRCV